MDIAIITEIIDNFSKKKKKSKKYLCIDNKYQFICFNFVV